MGRLKLALVHGEQNASAPSIILSGFFSRRFATYKQAEDNFRDKELYPEE